MYKAKVRVLKNSSATKHHLSVAAACQLTVVSWIYTSFTLATHVGSLGSARIRALMVHCSHYSELARYRRFRFGLLLHYIPPIYWLRSVLSVRITSRVRGCRALVPNCACSARLQHGLCSHYAHDSYRHGSAWLCKAS